MRKRKLKDSLTNIKRMKYYGDPVKDERVSNLYNRIQKRISVGFKSKLLVPVEEDNCENSILDIIIYILSKPLKNPNDIFILKLFLSDLEEFKRLFLSKDDSNASNSNSDELLTRIGLHLKYEKQSKNKVLMRFGDKGDKYYIILNGEVAILIPHEEDIHLNIIDYMKYLINLYLHKENEILSKAVVINQQVYHFKDTDVIALFDLYNTLREVNSIESEKGEIKDEKKFEYYQNLRNQLTTDKYVNLGNRAEIEILLMKALVGNSLLSYLSKNEMFMLYKYFCEFYYSIESKFTVKKTSTTNILDFALTLPNADSITVDDYINQLIPSTLTSNQFDSVVKYYKYTYVTYLVTGSNFGDLALQNSHQKRTATIIVVSDECHFGTLSKSVYEICIKNAKNRLRYKTINYFLNGPIFKSISSVLFEGKIFNYFRTEEFKKGYEFFKNGETLKNIYFIKEGEVELHTKMSLVELNDIIIAFGGRGDSKIVRKGYNEKRFNKKMRFRIGVLNHNEIVGLNDYINPKTGEYFCLCEVSSSKIQVFSLENHFLNILTNDATISQNINEYSNIKRKIILKRLISLYNQFSLPPLGLVNSNSEIIKRKGCNKQKTDSINIISNNNCTYKNLQQDNVTLLLSNNSKRNLSKTNTRYFSAESISNSIPNNNNKECFSTLNESINGSEYKKKLRNKILNKKTKINTFLASNQTHQNPKIPTLLKNSVIVTKSARYKKILLPKKINYTSMSPDNKKKFKILNEFRVRYLNKKTCCYTDRNFYTNPKNEIEKETYEENFRKLIKIESFDNTNSKTVKKRKTNSHFIDMLIMDKWNEKEMRENFSEETKNKYKSYIKQII